MRNVLLVLFILPIVSPHDSSHADVLQLTVEESWVEAAGEFDSIFFTEFPEFTTITDHYEDLGVLFTDGDDGIIHSNNSFPDDGAGLTSAFTDDITLEFLTPRTTIGVLFPGFLRIELYQDDELFFTSDLLGGGGPGLFGGLISDTPFDKAVLYDPLGFTVIDDLHFGQAIPAPGALPLLGLALLGHPRRRRR